MILSALINYYDRLEADPDENVASFGFSREKISFCVVLSADGTLADGELHDLRTQEGKRKTPARLVVPDRGGRSGTLIKPNFLWDNTGYALGCDSKGKPTRARQMFASFRDLHHELAGLVDDPGLQAVCRFLDQWDPDDASMLPDWEEICDSNIVFRLDGKRQYVHEAATIRRAWLQFVGGESDSARGCSLISGEEEDLARLHPLIQGVRGAQSTGAALASFNLDAFESYDKDQSYNAPVGIGDAFKYTTALNRLLADRARTVLIGDATVAFWSERPTDFEGLFGLTVSESAEDSTTVGNLAGFLKHLREGRPGAQLEDAAVPFYVLGLSPNSSRLAARFWLTGSVAQFADRLAQHFQDLDMVGGKPDDPPLVIRRLLWETAREAKEIPPLLAGALARAVLSGGDYPRALFTTVLRRIRADQTMNHSRAAILRAVLVRRARLARQTKENVPVSLDIDHPSPAYHIGRLFAALEKTQEDAHGHLNSTIKDRYFSSASATPAFAFARLMRLHQHHLNKMDDKPGLKVNREKLVQEIFSHVTRFPSHLSLDHQGLFFIGYYHQRQDFFTPKHTDTDTTSETQEVNA